MSALVNQSPAAAPSVIDETPGSMLAAIVTLAKDPSVDVAKLQSLMAMQERMEDREAERLFNIAFAEMEPKMPRIKKNGDVEYKNKQSGQMEKSFKFARWEDVDAGIRPILREHGFSLSFDTAPRQSEGGGLVVTGTLLHTSGHSKAASIPLPLDASGGKNNLQGAGSTLSYGKRYATTMLLNITTQGEDDDGIRGGMEYIGPGQVKTIRDLIAELDVIESAFLDFIRAESVEAIQVKDYTRAINALNKKRAAK